mgnify:CR=1 FL=1
MKEKRVLAVFDFDGTLVSRDTFKEFAVFVVGWRRFLWALALSVWPIMLWKTGLITGGRAKEKLFGRLYAGMSYGEFVRLGKEFAGQISAIERKQVVSTLKDHINKGNEVFIVTASMPEWIAGWAASYGIDSDHVIGTMPEIGPEGFLTGKFRGRNCRGEEKVSRLSSRIGIREDCFIYAYGDSGGDSELLSYADIGEKV